MSEFASKHRAAGRYRSMCPCCEPEAEPVRGRPTKQATRRPVMAWRVRLANGLEQVVQQATVTGEA